VGVDSLPFISLSRKQWNQQHQPEYQLQPGSYFIWEYVHYPFVPTPKEEALAYDFASAFGGADPTGAYRPSMGYALVSAYDAFPSPAVGGS
jgi:hypothetical protein